MTSMNKQEFVEKMFLFPVHYSWSSLWKVQMIEFWSRSYRNFSDGYLTDEEITERIEQLIEQTPYETINSKWAGQFSEGDRRRRPDECKVY